MSCAGCEALRAEVAFLRTQVVDLNDRLLVVSNPQAYAQLKGQSALPVSPAIESFVDEGGQAWITVAGKAVKLEEWQELMKGASVGLPNGQMVPDTELRRAMDKLDEMTGGS